ncbi:MAG: fumarylacetoacetate hydrolase family protein [Bdellovibrionales bacterium]
MDKIICVGKNYLKHAMELGDAIPEEPIYFLKPPSTIAKAQGKIALPANGDLHHELELVFEIGRRGGDWMFTRFTIGLDLTLRNLQAHLKKSGQPWEKAKVFRNSIVLGEWRPVSSLEQAMNMPFSLKVNGEVRQQGVGRDMRWTPDWVLQDLPKFFPLCEGDLLFTGTPEGVGPIKNGDVLRGECGEITWEFVATRD